MARFSPLLCVFYEKDDLNNTLDDSLGNGFIYPLTADYLEGRSEAGWYELSAPMTPYWSQLIAAGHVCVPIEDDDLLSEAKNFGPGFEIVDVEPVNDPAGAYIRFAGPELTDDLKYGEPIFRPIGAETVTETTLIGPLTYSKDTTLSVGAPSGNGSATVGSTSGALAGDQIKITMNADYGIHTAEVVTVISSTALTFTPVLPQAADAGNAVELRRYTSVTISPWSTTLAVGAPSNNDSCTVVTVTGLEVDDEVRITMNGSYGEHVATVTEIGGYLGTNRFTFTPRIPYNADAGKAVEFRKRKMRIADADLRGSFTTGTETHVVLNNLTTHYTTIAADPTEDETGVFITLELGLPSAVSSGKAINAYDYSTPATDDVSQIMAYKPDWVVVFDSGAYEGTAQGTFHAPTGDSVYDLLQATAQQTGEYWRMRPSTFGTIEKKIEWKRAAVAAGWNGGTLRLVMPNQADIDTHAANINRAIITGAVKPKTTGSPLTRIYPFAGDNRVSLALCSSDAIADANAAGFTVVLPGEGELWGSPYVKDAALEADAKIGIRARSVNFSHVRANVAKIPELRSAADQLLYESINWLQERQNARTFYDVDGVVSACPIHPGNTVEIYYEDPNGEWTIYRVGAEALHVLEVSRRYDATTDGPLNGVPVYTLRLADYPQAEPSTERTTAGIARDTERLVRTSGSTGSTAVSVGSVTIVEGTNDHPPATAGHAAVNVTSEQAVSVVLAGPSGLEIADTGLALANTVAGDGLSIVNKILALNLAGNSGLLLAGDALQLGIPLTVGATTLSTVVGTGHTHSVTAVSSAKASPGQLVKGDANGDSIWRWLTADIVKTPRIESTGGITLDPANSLITADGNLSFVGARQIVTDSGSLTLAPVASLILDPPGDVVQVNSATTLKTAHWSSGFLGTGWGMTYAGELDARKIYADELHVAAFIADTARVKVGSEYITPSMALVSRNFTIPAVGGSGTLYVEDAPGLSELPVFADSDWVLLRIMDRSGGGLLVANVWGQVSGYVGLGDGEQSWLFTCKSSSATGQVARRGSVVLDFGKAGDGWWWVTTLDPAGSPYAGITTWQGDDPYTEGNRTHRLRMGQLKGVSGVYEWGLQAGTATSSRFLFSDLRNEIHGSRLSLYAGNAAEARVIAAAVQFYRTSTVFDTLVPNADHNSTGAVSSGGSFYQAIDESTGTPNYSDYVANGTNQSGFVTVGLGNPTSFSSIYRVRLACVLLGNGFSGDTVRVYGQVFAADEVTPLTAEVRLATFTSNTTVSTTPILPHDATATMTQWNGARLRLRWEYDINANAEAIRLDPNVPSLAVGNALPTGYSSGGAGLWVGLDSGAYKLRLGEAVGVGLRWDGTTLALRSATNSSVIELDTSGNSRFSGVMNIGSSGGIYQGTGSFGSPTTGLKVWNDGGVGRLATYNSGTAQVYFDTTGTLTAGAGNVLLDSAGLRLLAETVGSPGWIALPNVAKSLTYKTDGGTEIGYLSAAYYAATNWRGLQLSLKDSSNRILLGSSGGMELYSSNITIGSPAIPGDITVIGDVVLDDGFLQINDGGVIASGNVQATGYFMGAGVNMSGVSSNVASGLVLPRRTTHPTAPDYSQDVQLYIYETGGVKKLYMQNSSGTKVQIATF